MVTDISVHTPCSNQRLSCICCTTSSKDRYLAFYQSKLLVFVSTKKGTAWCSTLSFSNVLLWLVLCAGMLVFVTSITGWPTKCHTFGCAHNTFLLLQKHLTSGTELILIGWKTVPNEEHVQCDHRFASQPLANKPLHSSQLFDTSLPKARGTTSLCGPWAALHFLTFSGLQRRLWRMQGFVCKRLWGKMVVTLNIFFIRNNFPACED